MGNEISLADGLDYNKDFLAGLDLNTNPLLQFESWLLEANRSGYPEPSAMQLSTIGADGCPHSRMVLFKGMEGSSLVFYTNYESAKAREMEFNPAVAVLFFWPLLERQVRIEGLVSKTSAENSDAYFATRPRESQIGAWASPQSSVVTSGEELEQLYADAAKRFLGLPVPRPPHWGGYYIKPELFEFWQGKPGRMHQRYRYTAEGNSWGVSRLAP